MLQSYKYGVPPHTTHSTHTCTFSKMLPAVSVSVSQASPTFTPGRQSSGAHSTCARRCSSQCHRRTSLSETGWLRSKHARNLQELFILCLRNCGLVKISLQAFDIPRCHHMANGTLEIELQNSQLLLNACRETRRVLEVNCNVHD